MNGVIEEDVDISARGVLPHRVYPPITVHRRIVHKVHSRPGIFGESVCRLTGSRVHSGNDTVSDGVSAREPEFPSTKVVPHEFVVTCSRGHVRRIHGNLARVARAPRGPSTRRRRGWTADIDDVLAAQSSISIQGENVAIAAIHRGRNRIVVNLSRTLGAGIRENLRRAAVSIVDPCPANIWHVKHEIMPGIAGRGAAYRGYRGDRVPDGGWLVESLFSPHSGAVRSGPDPAAFTVNVAVLLVTVPTALVTATRNVEPLSAVVVAGVM